MSKPPHKKSPATATLTVASKKAVNNLAPPLDATPTPAVASTITERPSPIKNGNGVQVQVKISLQMQQKFDKLQKELLQLQAEKSARETEELTSAHLAAKKQQKQRNKSNATAKTTTTNNDDDATSVEDPTLDYTLEENYSVRRFVGHKIKLNEGKGPPVVTLLATWKGYPTEEKPTVEKWGTMKTCHSRQLKRYMKRTEELRKTVENLSAVQQAVEEVKNNGVHIIR